MAISAARVALALILILAVPARAQQAVPEGTWIVSDRVAIAIYDCASNLCGRIVWLRNPTLRTAEFCGRTIVWGLVAQGGGAWADGSFFDPENGSTYNLSAQLESPDRIAARIYEGLAFLGRTEILSRIPSGSLDGWC